MLVHDFWNPDVQKDLESNTGKLPQISKLLLDIFKAYDPYVHKTRDRNNDFRIGDNTGHDTVEFNEAKDLIFEVSLPDKKSGKAKKTTVTIGGGDIHGEKCIYLNRSRGTTSITCTITVTSVDGTCLIYDKNGWKLKERDGEECELESEMYAIAYNKMFEMISRIIPRHYTEELFKRDQKENIKSFEKNLIDQAVQAERLRVISVIDSI